MSLCRRCKQSRRSRRARSRSQPRGRSASRGRRRSPRRRTPRRRRSSRRRKWAASEQDIIDLLERKGFDGPFEETHGGWLMEKGRDYMVGKYPDKYGIHLPNPQLQDPVEFGLNEERKVIDWIESNL